MSRVRSLEDSQKWLQEQLTELEEKFEGLVDSLNLRQDYGHRKYSFVEKTEAED